MWHMPNIPPKKAHLEFLLKCAALKLRQSELEAEKEGDSNRWVSTKQIAIQRVETKLTTTMMMMMMMQVHAHMIQNKYEY